MKIKIPRDLITQNTNAYTFIKLSLSVWIQNKSVIVIDTTLCTPCHSWLLWYLNANSTKSIKKCSSLEYFIALYWKTQCTVMTYTICVLFEVYNRWQPYITEVLSSWSLLILLVTVLVIFVFLPDHVANPLP
jgi:hypothetical protein